MIPCIDGLRTDIFDSEQHGDDRGGREMTPRTHPSSSATIFPSEDSQESSDSFPYTNHNCLLHIKHGNMYVNNRVESFGGSVVGSNRPILGHLKSPLDESNNSIQIWPQNKMRLTKTLDWIRILLIIGVRLDWTDLFLDSVKLEIFSSFFMKEKFRSPLKSYLSFT